MAVSTYTVSGMTCGHCVTAVTQEVEALPGVSDVQVTLDSGQLVVTSEPAVSREQVRTAVDEAGYELADA
jgi:copper chaperone